MLVSIDHSTHPHIIDLIFAYAPASSLVVLRRTCRSFRDRVDATLFRHVALRATGTNKKLGLHFVVPPGRMDMTSRLPRVPSRVEILDSVPFDLPAKPSAARTHAVRNILRQLTSLHTVRRFSQFNRVPSFGGLGYTTTHTLVDFVDQSQQTGRPLDKHHRLRMGSIVQMYVLNLRTCVRHHCEIAPTKVKSLREIVIAVHPCCDAEPRVPVLSIYPILVLVNNLLMMGRRISLTFVGVPPPAIIGPLQKATWRCNLPLLPAARQMRLLFVHEKSRAGVLSGSRHTFLHTAAACKGEWCPGAHIIVEQMIPSPIHIPSM
ncbi:uncharacterized protein LOC62_04G005290 [Vanrija pseudolonga]|uniref:F-box domain-containing protein n=1 Tax=Vanrija pseudolonga TaxID=143232 RepID=A0AAF0YBJ9_9TREE|nr:hypothetical protein LOC62_04G005290 [Vanrija pseudolonga]